MADDLPAAPGSYVLYLVSDQPQRLSAGRLGDFSFPAGQYLYAGSAFGPGGLRARVRHHLRQSASPHWHIDWLRRHTTIIGVWYAPVAIRLECAWSKAAAAMPGAWLPAPGFGASDCEEGCGSHLVAFMQAVQPKAIHRTLQLAAGGAPVVFWQV